MIYLYTYIRQGFISNFHYQDLLSVSRNTSLSDLKKLKEFCAKFEIDISYSRAEGYHLRGRQEDKDRMALYTISVFLKSPLGSWALDTVLRAWQETNFIEELKTAGQMTCQLYHLSPLQERLDEYLYFFQFLVIRQKRVSHNLTWPKVAVSEFSQKLVQIFWQKTAPTGQSLTEGLAAYLSVLLQGCLEGSQGKEEAFFQALTLEIVEEMERLSLIAFDKRADLIEGLQRHLIPAYYRLQFQLVSHNSYTEVIKEEHKNLFELVKKALSPLERHLGLEIPDSEVAYFAVHFGGYIETDLEETFRYKALLICPNSISLALVVRGQLSQMFPNVDFSDTQVATHLQSLNFEGYDMVFSTVKLESERPFFLLPQLMSADQKKEVFYQVMSIFPDAGYFPLEVEELLALIGKHASIRQEQALKYDLAQFMNRKKLQQYERSPMLEELITRETYQHCSEDLSWQEAVALSAQPLLANASIDKTYIDAMIAKIEAFGPFIDLGKGVAIPHARPEDGVNRIGMSMLTLEKPVCLLGDPDHAVSVLICIAAVDNQTHLRALSHLTAILREADNITQLVNSRCFDDISELLKEEG